MISYRYCTGEGPWAFDTAKLVNSAYLRSSCYTLYIYIYIGVISALLDLIIKHSGYRFHHRSTRDIMNLIFKPRSLSLAPFSEISFAPRTFRSHLYIYIFFSLFPTASYYSALIDLSWNIEFQSSKILLFEDIYSIVIIRFIFYDRWMILLPFFFFLCYVFFKNPLVSLK